MFINQLIESYFSLKIDRKKGSAADKINIKIFISHPNNN